MADGGASFWLSFHITQRCIRGLHGSRVGLLSLNQSPRNPSQTELMTLGVGTTTGIAVVFSVAGSRDAAEASDTVTLAGHEKAQNALANESLRSSELVPKNRDVSDVYVSFTL